MSICTSTIGYPRIGKSREVKKALESFWSGKIESAELLKNCQRSRNRKLEDSIRNRDRSHWYW
ncbi:hypothetical protein [Anaplasma marginale]|uniref:hypothetical protein n=1 Tax=Anaplasma marginale TaxID=770 RepID=UPI0018E974EB